MHAVPFDDLWSWTVEMHKIDKAFLGSFWGAPTVFYVSCVPLCMSMLHQGPRT